MQQFEIFIPKKVDTLSNLLDTIASEGINIKAIATESRDDIFILKIVTQDDKTTEKVLKNGKYKYNTSEILSIKLIDRPGELAKFTKILAKAKINIESIYILGKEDGSTEVGIKPDNLELAKKILKII
ncbi:MAG: ACT domain-containing protein [Candidatus Aenigmatarchaeota archaeon]